MSNAWTGIKSEVCISSYVAKQKKNYCTRSESLWDTTPKEYDKMSPGQCKVNPPSILELTITDHQIHRILQLFWISSI
jgi:hypothetical protein